MTLLKIFILSLLFVLIADAKEINIIKDNLSLPILNKSQIFIDSQKRTLKEITNQRFDDFDEEYINLGPVSDTIWVKFRLKNDSLKTIDKLLVINNPLLTTTKVYKAIEKII